MDGKQLKNSILQWAIQGKLVPQNPKDEPASKLLERIAAIRHSEQSEESSKRSKKTSKTPTSRIYRENGVWYEQVGNAEPKDISDDIPFEIPENWAWCRFGNLVFNRDSERIPLSVEQRMGLKKIYDYYGASGVIDKVDNFLFDKPLLLIGEDGANLINRSTPIAFIARGQYWVNNHAHVIDCINEDLMQYVCTYINAISLVDYVTGTAQPKMNQEKMNSIFVAVPPLAEQKRIVAKLEQVLPLVDEYNAAQKQLDKLNKELPEALKKSILQQAIQGKLVPQTPKDEPAQKLLERIASSRHSEQSEESSKRSKKISKNPTSRIYCENGSWYEQVGNAAPKDISEEIPFDIPTSWVWCRLDCLGTFVRGNGIKRDETIPTGKPCVRYGEMYTTYKVKFYEVKSFTKKDIFDKCHKIHKNDILMALTGENKWDIALAATYQGDDEAAIGGDLCKFTPIECNPLYLVYLINSPYGIGYKRETSTGDIIVHTSVGKLGNFLVPLPPLAEQKRIVAKLEQLFKVL